MIEEVEAESESPGHSHGLHWPGKEVKKGKKKQEMNTIC